MTGRKIMPQEIMQQEIMQQEIRTAGARVIAAPRLLDPARDRADMVAPAGSTLAGIVALALPGLPEGRRGWVRVTIGDRLVPAHLWPLVRPRPGALVLIRLVPAGGNALRQILMIAVAVAAMAIGQFWVGPAMAGALGLAQSTWAAIGTAATMAAGTLLVNALVPAKKPSNAKDPTRYAISGQNNAIAPNAPIPIALGRIRFAPPYACLPWTEDAGDFDQYYVAAFIVGVGPHAISDIRIGDTPISKYAGAQLEIRNGWPGDAPLTLVPQQIVEQAEQTQISHEDGPVTRVSGGDADAISVTIRFPAGLISVNSKGKRFEIAIGFTIRARLAGTATWDTVGNVTVSRKTTKDFRIAHRWDCPTRGRYEIEITRTTPDYDDSDNTQAASWLVAVRTFRPEYPFAMPAAAPLALIATRIKASRQLQGVLDNLTALVEPLMADFDAASGAWIVRSTRNPASIARYLLQGPLATWPLPDARLDLARWADWHGHCAAKGLSYDGVITDETALRDVLADVCAAGRARLLDRGDMISVVIDRPVAEAVAMISPRNAREIGWTPHYTRYPDAVRVPFLDGSNDYKQAERVVPWIGATGEPQITEEWELPGQTDAASVWRAARRRMRELIHRPYPYTAVMDVEHLLVEPGDRVLLSHPWLADEAVAARVARVDGATLTLDAPVTMTAGQTYRVRLRDAAGALRVADVVTTPGESAEVRLTAALTPPPAAGDLALIGRYGEETVDCLVSRIEPGDDWTATLTLLRHAPEIDAETDADAPPPWDGRAGGIVVDTRYPIAPLIVEIASGYEIADEPEGTVRVRMAPAAAETMQIASYSLRWRVVGATTWTDYGGLPGVGSFVSAPGEQVEIEARAVAWNGHAGAWSATQTYTVLAMQADGPVIATLTVDKLASGLRRYAWAFAAPPPGGLEAQIGVELRIGAAGVTAWESLTPLHSAYLLASPWETSQPADDGDYAVAARATALSGEVGPVKLIAISTQPAPPVSISASVTGSDIAISVTMSVATDSGALRIYRSLASAAASTEVDVSGLLAAPPAAVVTWTNTGAAASGQPDYRYRARAENGAGVKSPPTSEVLP